MIRNFFFMVAVCALSINLFLTLGATLRIYCKILCWTTNKSYFSSIVYFQWLLLR